MLRRKERRWAAIFAEDLLRGYADLFAAFGGETLTLPISIPIAEDGMVLLLPGGPLQAPRVAATMTVTRQHDARIVRADGGTMRIPGLDGGEPLTELGFTIMPDGLTITADGRPDLHDEDTARALAHALLITIAMKLAKAVRGEAGR